VFGSGGALDPGMEARRTLRRMWEARMLLRLVVMSSLGLAACGSEPAPEASGAKSGSPRTGGDPTASPDQAAATSAVDAHRAAVKALVQRAALSVDLAAVEALPLVTADVTLDEATRSVSAEVRVTVLNAGAAPLREVVLVVPANAARPNEPPVTLDRVEVSGKLTDPRGDRARWIVPVDVAPGAEVTLTLRIAAALPAALPTRDAPAGGIAALAEVVPGALLEQLGTAEADEALGVLGGVTVLAGILPEVEGAAGMNVELAVTAPSDATVVTTGVEVGSERRGALSTTRVVAIGARGVVAVAARGLASTPLAAGAVQLLALHPSDAAESARELLTVARRALETLEPTWGRPPVGALALVAVPMLDGAGVVSLPRLVLVPASAFTGPEPSVKDDALGALLANHPVPRDVAALAVAGATAAQWWLGRGADPLARLVLEDGVARAAGLRVITRMSGERAVARARELGLRLPLQLALERGQEPLLAGSATWSRVASLKAALFAVALQRVLGEELLDEALRALPEGPLTGAAVRAALLAKAPRRAELEALVTRWLDEAHAADDVGPIEVGELIELFVTEGAVDSGLGLAMNLLGDRPDLAAKGLDVLGGGGSAPSLALDLLDELTGDKDPAVKRWFDTAKGLLGKDRDQALGQLVDDLGQELGIPAAERSRLRLMVEQVTRALGDGGALEPPPYVPLAPPDPDLAPAPPDAPAPP